MRLFNGLITTHITITMVIQFTLSKTNMRTLVIDSILDNERLNNDLVRIEYLSIYKQLNIL
jgi:hypothetical protein